MLFGGGGLIFWRIRNERPLHLLIEGALLLIAGIVLHQHTASWSFAPTLLFVLLGLGLPFWVLINHTNHPTRKS
jgi:hypothetical protein